MLYMGRGSRLFCGIDCFQNCLLEVSTMWIKCWFGVQNMWMICIANCYLHTAFNDSPTNLTRSDLICYS